MGAEGHGRLLGASGGLRMSEMGPVADCLLSGRLFGYLPFRPQHDGDYRLLPTGLVLRVLSRVLFNAHQFRNLYLRLRFKFGVAKALTAHRYQSPVTGR